MVSKSSKPLPYIVLFIVIAALGYEAYSGTSVDIEAYIPLLIAMGIGGAGLEAVRSAAKAKKAIPSEVESRIKTELKQKIDEIKSL